MRSDSHYKIEVTPSNVTILMGTIARRDDPAAEVDALAVPATGHVRNSEPETSSYEVYTIERIEVKVPFIVEKARRIPDNKIVSPSKYRLRFRGKDDKVITDF